MTFLLESPKKNGNVSALLWKLIKIIQILCY